VAGRLLECELLSLLGGDDKSRVMARYCGFDGFGGATLHVVGEEFGITAERVRQILGEVVKRAAKGPPRSAVLDKTLSFVAGCIPARAEEIESKLPAAGLSEQPFRIEGLIRAAELFGRKPAFSLAELPKGRLVHGLSTQSLDAVVRAARRAIERRGVTTIHAVAADLLETVPEAAERRVITKVLEGAEDLRWLDQPAEWFWLPDVPRNPLVRRIRKILAMANPVPLSKLCAGIAREYRLQSYSPPAAVLLELCRQTPGVLVEGDLIKAEPPISPRGVLCETEQAIVDVLLEHGGAMRRAGLASACFERGVNRASFYGCLSYSPVIAPQPGGFLALVGTEMAPAPVPVNPPRSRRVRGADRTHAVSLHHLMH
jgi:hypothetical protein